MATIVNALQGTIARTDTAPKNLFQLPADATLIGVLIGGDEHSNAGEAYLSVGPAGSPARFVFHGDVTGVASKGLQVPQAEALGDVGAEAVQVVGMYTERGAASTTGGPWTVTLLYTEAD